MTTHCQKRVGVLMCVGVCMLAFSFGLIACSKRPDEPPPRTTSIELQAAATQAVEAGNGLPANLKLAGTCNIETINAQPAGTVPVAVAASGTFAMSGWAFDPELKSPADSIHAVLLQPETTRIHRIKARGRLPRPDTARVFELKDQVDVGFEVSGAALTLPAGIYRLVLLLESRSGIYLCDNGRKVQVVS